MSPLGLPHPNMWSHLSRDDLDRGQWPLALPMKSSFASDFTSRA